MTTSSKQPVKERLSATFDTLEADQRQHVINAYKIVDQDGTEGISLQELYTVFNVLESEGCYSKEECQRLAQQFLFQHGKIEESDVDKPVPLDKFIEKAGISLEEFKKHFSYWWTRRK